MPSAKWWPFYLGLNVLFENHNIMPDWSYMGQEIIKDLFHSIFIFD